MNNRTECSPRIIKRTNVKEQTDNALKYDFYRQINHLSIIKLNNETDKLNYSSWLTRLDKDSSDLRMHLIKLLFISLRSDRSFQMFLKPPPDDLKDLELMIDNTMEMVKNLQDTNKVEESMTNEDIKQEIKHKRSAAVATDLHSYTTIKTSPYFVQSFYVRSDFPIYTWFNPTSIRLPISFNHNEWELYLNQFQILSEDKQSNNKHKNECDDIIPIEQETKEVATAFSWHPYSIFKNDANRPKRTAASIEIDLDVASQQCNQQQIDDAAFSIVLCKVFPGNKILSRKMYTCTLMPDAKFIFKMTGVTLVDYSNLKLKNNEQLPNACILRQRKRAKNSCEDKDDTPRKKQTNKVCCSKPQLLLPCSEIGMKNKKQLIQIKPSINTISTTNTNTNKVNTENDSKFNNPNMTRQECGISTSKCLKKGAKKTKPVECCRFPKEEDLENNNTSESKEPNKCPTILNAGRSSLNDSSKCDWTVSSVEISMRESDRASSCSPPPVEKAPNFNANCKSLSSDQVACAKPEDQSARHCSNVQLTEASAAAKSPHRSPRTTESSREPSQEHHHRQSRGNSNGAISERTVNSGCTDASCTSDRSRTPSVQERSIPEPRDCATARGGRSASDCGQRGGLCPVREQNLTCPARLTEQQPQPQPPTPTPTPMQTRTDTSNSGATQFQQQEQHQPQQQYQQQQQHQQQEQHQPQQQYQQQQQHQQQQTHLQRQQQQHHQLQQLQQQRQQQQHQYQHQFSVPSERSAASVAAAAAAAASAPNWDPEVSSYAAFSDRRITEDQSRFMTSERTIDHRLPMVLRAQALPPPSPANDFRSADYDDDLSGSSAGASDWSAEEEIDRCQSCNVQNSRFCGIGDDNNYDDDDRASSLSTLTSDDSSIELRLAARHVPLVNVNYDRRTGSRSLNINDRYPFDGRLTSNVSDISLQGNDSVEVWPTIHNLIENVSRPGSEVIGPWSLSSSVSRSGRIREFGDVSAPDPYDTSCSDGGNASGRDDYVDRPHNSFGAFGTDDDGAGAVPMRRRSH